MPLASVAAAQDRSISVWLIVAALKLAVADVLPAEFLARPKQGFRVPVDEWVLDRLGEQTRQEVDAFCRDSGLLDHGEAARVLARPKRDAWYLLNLALWWREYVA